MVKFILPLPADPCDTRIVVGYARVSTTHREQDLSIEGQILQLEKAGVDRVIAERQSGSDGSRRPGWEELNALVASKRVRMVLMVDLSRLARDGTDLQFLELCSYVGTEVRDLHGQVWEVASVGGLLSAGVTSLMNRVQARMIGIKARDGIRRRREAGYLARGVLPFGYKAGERAPEPHPGNWSRARDLLELYMAHEANAASTLRALPASFPWHPYTSGLRNWIRNPILRGGIGYGRGPRGWDRVEWGVCPALMSAAEWDQIEAMTRTRRTGRRMSPDKQPCTTRLFTGMIRCSCKQNLRYHTQAKPTHAPRYQCRNPRCKYSGRTVKQQIIRDVLVVELCKRAKRMAQVLLADVPVEETPELTKLRTQLRQLEELDEQGVEGLRPTITKLRDEIAAIQTAGLGQQSWLHPDYQKIFSDPENFRLTSDENLRTIMLHFVKRIEYSFLKQTVRVVFRA